MKEIPFSIPITGVIKIDGQQVTVVFQQAQINLTVNDVSVPVTRFVSNGGTLPDIVLETARIVAASGKREFTAAELYKEAIKTHPKLKRNSWGATVIAAAPNHNSYKHYTAHRDYFEYLGQGKYRLKEDCNKRKN